ncbi:MAG: putative collagen-binding domain-containing protein, partial [Gemmataceae bacterium]
LTGAYTAKWFDPRTGAVGPPVRLMGSGTLALTPPASDSKDADWAVLLEGE